MKGLDSYFSKKSLGKEKGKNCILTFQKQI